MTDRFASARRRRRPTSGSGFDCAAVALDLWNELEVVETTPMRRSRTSHHLGIGAFARLAPPTGRRFDFTYADPASSAASARPRP